MDRKKYIVILGDGMADYPDAENRTPLSRAHKPTMDALAKSSEIGLLRTVPEGMKPGSDTANLSVMGYDPKLYYTGRSPLEAVSMGLKMTESSVSYRCNLVTLSGEDEFSARTMIDYSAGEITTAEAKELIEYLAKELSLPLYAGISYRHCLLLDGVPTGTELTPPHDITGKRIAKCLPSGVLGEKLLEIEKAAAKLLEKHPVNLARKAKGLNVANSVWFWGEGVKPKLTTYRELFRLSGTVVSAVDLIKGIGILAGLKVPEIIGATGTVETNFDGKAQAAIDAIKSGDDFVYVHLEAPDECGHQGDERGKIRAIELIDEKIVKPILAFLRNGGYGFKLAFLPDHPTPLSLRTHVSDPVPYLIYDSTKAVSGAEKYDESHAAASGNFIGNGFEFLPKLINK